MAFFLRGALDEKLPRKSLKLLDRLKARRPEDSEICCLLCADSSLMLQEVILCTDRAVYYHPRLSTGLNKYDLSSISAVSLEVVSGFPSVSLTISNGEAVKLYVATKEAEKMADYIKNRIPRSAPAASSSPADEILKYKGLLDCGAITEAEFEAKKRQLLGV